MKPLDWTGRVTIAASLALAFGCGSLDSPTDPEPEHSSVSKGDAGVTVGAPTPTASPSASPAPEDSQPSPAPGGSEASAACDTPLPPAVSKMDAKVHLRGASAWILDATPLVGPDVEYCKKIGFTDGRTFCAVRPEGNPQRAACELYAVGKAKDTNRAGPTWYADGQLCQKGANGCENHPDNQYLLLAYRGGTYSACAGNNVCGEVVVDR